jgi:outer membrane protein assembly factor BamB
MIESTSRAVRGPVTAGALLALAAAFAVDTAAIAQATDAAPAATEAPAPETPEQAAARRRTERRAAQAALDERYVVGPTVADDFGYRIVWQTEPLVTLDATMQVLGASQDSLWMGDSAGSVVRIRRDNGEVVWRASTNQGVERMLGIEYLPTPRHDNAYVVNELGMVTLDAVTGNVLRRARFSQLPATEPSVFGSYLVFGTRTGLTSWFQYVTGYNWRSTTIGGAVNGRITIAGDMAIAAGTNGTVMALSAGTAGVVWTRKLSAGVEASVAADDVACYVAGRDQSLWAFDLMRGRVLWQYFTQTPLLNPPARVGDGLYLQIPGEGLVSFVPQPAEKPDGEVRWKSKAPGNVLAQVRSDVMVWDRASRTLTAVDVATGRIVREAKLPKVEAIRFAADSTVVVASADGRIQRLETLAQSAAGAASAREAAAMAPQSPSN